MSNLLEYLIVKFMDIVFTVADLIFLREFFFILFQITNVYLYTFCTQRFYFFFILCVYFVHSLIYFFLLVVNKKKLNKYFNLNSGFDPSKKNQTEYLLKWTSLISLQFTGLKSFIQYHNSIKCIFFQCLAFCND